MSIDWCLDDKAQQPTLMGSNISSQKSSDAGNTQLNAKNLNISF